MTSIQAIVYVCEIFAKAQAVITIQCIVLCACLKNDKYELSIGLYSCSGCVHLREFNFYHTSYIQI